MNQVLEQVAQSTDVAHDVHLYVVTRVKVCNIKAPTAAQAAFKAEEMALDQLHEILDHEVMFRPAEGPYIKHTEYAEDGAQYFLVDPHVDGQVDCEKSQWLDRKFRPMAEADAREKKLKGFLERLSQVNVASDPKVLTSVLSTFKMSAGTLLREVD